MSIRFRCPQCKTPLNAPDNYAGGSAKCKKCGAKIRIPTPVCDGRRRSKHDAPASALPGSPSSDARSASTAVVPEDEATPPSPLDDFGEDSVAVTLQPGESKHVFLIVDKPTNAADTDFSLYVGRYCIPRGPNKDPTMRRVYYGRLKK